MSTDAPSPHFLPLCSLSGRKVTAPLSWQTPERALTLETQPQRPHSFVRERFGTHLGRQEHLGGGTPGEGQHGVVPEGKPSWSLVV